MGAALKPGKHTIVFDFKYDGPGPAKGGTGVLSVDGKEYASKSMPHSIRVPDGHRRDLRHRQSIAAPAVDDSYKLPFQFTGKIDKLTFNLGPTQMTSDEQKSCGTRLKERGIECGNVAECRTAINTKRK